MDIVIDPVLAKITDNFSRDRLITIKRDFLNRKGSSPHTTQFVVNKLCGALDKQLTHEGRNNFLSWLTGRVVTTSKYNVEGGLNEWDGFKLCMWARPVYIKGKLDQYAETLLWDMIIVETAFKLSPVSEEERK